MAYAAPHDHLINTESFSRGSVSIHPVYPHEDCVGDNQIWMENIQHLLRRGQDQSYSSLSWQYQQPYLQHFEYETEKVPFSTGPASNLRHISQHDMPIVASLPQALASRMVSPAPSQGLSTPTSSSARSPATDPEWYPDTYYPPPMHDDLSFPSDMSCSTQGHSNACAEPSAMTLFAESTGYPCVNMSQVQGFIDPQEFAEPQEDTFEANERYMDIDQAELSIHVDHQVVRENEVPTYQRSNATRKRHESSTQDAEYREQSPSRSATDAEGDLEGEDDILEDEASDTEYTPKSIRVSRRRVPPSPKPSSASSVRRGRATKSKSLKSTKPSKLQLQLMCRFCKGTFDNSTSLQRHMDNSHPRAFTCVFNFAGCASTFASKNEWKRHVSTQHLNFHSWVCDLGDCGKAHTSSSPKNGSGGQISKGPTFNRKDLFTQHLRRMHAPTPRKRQDKHSTGWDDRMRELQTTCLRVRRQQPKVLKCPVSECGCDFEGFNCWDDRMEHVAKHLEKAAGARGPAGVQHEKDDLLVSWALKEGIVGYANGVYKLVPMAAWVDILDEDADGEDEY